MKKIVMFFGSDRAFVERIPKAYRNLSDIAMQMDDENKQMQLVLVGLPGNENAPSKTKKPKIKVNNFVIFADEYSSVNEHVIINFLSFISKLSITNMYIQNPPIHCSCAKFLSQLLIIFDTNFRKIFSEFNTRNGGIFALRFFDI